MSAEEILLQNEDVATEHNQFVSHVSGKGNFSYKEKNFFQKFGAAGLLTVGLIVVAIMFSSGNVIPSAISQRLVEETDVQYADAVVSKELVFQQALKNGEVPQNTAEILKRNGVLVGYSDGDSFVETSTADRELELKINQKNVDSITSNVLLHANKFKPRKPTDVLPIFIIPRHEWNKPESIILNQLYVIGIPLSAFPMIKSPSG